MSSKEKRIQVSKDNVVDLYNTMQDYFSDIRIALNMMADGDIDMLSAKELIRDKIEIVSYKMDKVWNPIIEDLKQKNQINYAMFKKFETTEQGSNYYEKYLKTKAIIEKIERGDIEDISKEIINL